MSTRRDVLKFGAAAAAAASVTMSSSPSAALAATDAALLAPPDAAPWTLLTPYRSGDAIGEWTLTGLTGVAAGAVIVQLARSDRTARVHVCAHQGAPRGLASSDRFDLLLMNQGDGRTPTDESLARALALLAVTIEANTDGAVADHPELGALLTHPERLRAFDSAGSTVLT